MYNLLYGVEVLVVEVAEEPEDARSEDLSQEHHERGEVEDEDHASQPVEKHYRTCHTTTPNQYSEHYPRNTISTQY